MTLCIFAKEPVPGTVKTRLAKTVGNEQAARLASAFLKDTISAIATLNTAKVIAWCGCLERAPSEMEVWPQGEGGLGERIERIFSRALSHSTWVIALGADSPGVPREYVRAAIGELNTHDAVIGPTLDGGYYLLGLTRCEPGILGGIEWSQPSTRSQTVDRLTAHRYRVATVGTWFDVDDAQDLAHLKRLLAEGVIDAEETAREVGIHEPRIFTPKSDERE